MQQTCLLHRRLCNFLICKKLILFLVKESYISFNELTTNIIILL